MAEAAPLRIVWLVEETEQSDDVHLAIAQADAMIARGAEARIVTTGLPVTWRTSRAEWIFVDTLRDYRPAGDEIVVAQEEVPLAGMIVDEEFFRDQVPRDNHPLRVLLAGESQDETAGIRDGYGAVAHARWFHQKLELVRLSAWVPSREEPLDAVQEFHVGLTATERRRLMHSCDLLIAPELREGRLRLHVAEAMAAGLPCLLTDIPAHRGLDPANGYAVFARESNAVELGERLMELLEDASLRGRLRKRGGEVAGQWRQPRAAERIEAFFRGQKR